MGELTYLLEVDGTDRTREKGVVSGMPGTLVQDTENIMSQLPPELQQEVHDFARYLLEAKAKPERRRKPTFAWRGALKDLRDQYTSVELQHEILKSWGD